MYVPCSLTLSLLEVDSKQEVIRACDDAVITPKTLSALISTAQARTDICTYRRLEVERPMGDLQPTPDQMRDFTRQLEELTQSAKSKLTVTGRGAKAVSKIFQFADHRRDRIGHLVVSINRPVWFFLYADQRDTSVSNTHWEKSQNHWSEGPHMHLAHSFTTNRTMDAYLKSFMNDDRLPKSQHVRFFDPEWGQEWHEKWSPENRLRARVAKRPSSN
jgi:hypothetical protein